jgi:lipoteichoic acid synthase
MSDPTPATPEHRAIAWAMALLLASWTAKLAELLFRIHDGGGQGVWTPLGPLALLHDDFQIALPFGVAIWALHRLLGERAPRLASRVTAGIYGCLTFWIMFNIPVVRLMSSTVTYAFLHATGPALGDSFTRYATVANLGTPLVLWFGSLWLCRRLCRVRSYPRHSVPIGLTFAFALSIVGPFASARIEAAGLNGNAVVVFAKSLLNRGARTTDSFPDLNSSTCVVDSGAPPSAVADLRDLLRVAAGRNVLWVILESTRARSLHTYGATRDVTPHLTALAENAVVFENAYAAYPESIKGLFSMLCARPPPQGKEASEYHARAVSCQSIAEVMSRAGYRTGLFHSSWFAYLGMKAVVEERGFDETVDAEGVASVHRSSFGVDDRATAQRVLSFVDATPAGTPFFAVYMPIAGHHPYHTPGNAARPLAEKQEHDEYLNDLFVGDIAFGELRAGLKDRGLDQKTMYVVVGDHGEAFREHDGNVAHALFLYEENVHVPFVVAAPGLWKQQRRVPQPVSLIDLSPTTLALLGVPLPESYPVAASFLGGTRSVRFFTEQATHRAGLRDNRFKFIVNQENGRSELFDLQVDPDEKRDLASLHPDRVSRYRRCLQPLGP